MFRQERRAARPTPPAAKGGKGRSARNSREGGAGDNLCHVLISADGTVSVGGEVIATATGDTAQTAVLDHLHGRAVVLARPVEASVLDHQRRATLRIRVWQDGASELMADPSPLDKDVPPAPPAPSSGPAQAPAPAPAPAAVSAASGNPYTPPAPAPTAPHSPSRSRTRTWTPLC